MLVYLDLNIFDRIEKKDSLEESEREIYLTLEKLILEKVIIVPYSNAHLNDLFRGFQKDPSYIEGHLKNIEKLTNNLCLCQYWGEKEIIFHHRKIHEFFESKKNEWEDEPTSFTEIFNDFDEDMSWTLTPFKLIPLDPIWKTFYSNDPMFGVMFPKSKKDSTFYSLLEDIFDFQFKLKQDYSLYRTFKSYLIRNVNKLKNNKEVLKSVKSNFKDLPKHLELIEISEQYFPEQELSKNKNYSKIVETFYKFDLKGYKTDKNFNNMFDDSLHTFYGSHCDFFITNDDRCKYKAEKTYEKLNIDTTVINAVEFEQILKSP